MKTIFENKRARRLDRKTIFERFLNIGYVFGQRPPKKFCLIASGKYSIYMWQTHSVHYKERKKHFVWTGVQKIIYTDSNGRYILKIVKNNIGRYHDHRITETPTKTGQTEANRKKI